MAYIFSNTPGYAVALTDNSAIPAAVWLENWETGDAHSIAIQSVTVRSAGNYQFLQTLRRYMYVYIFGELPSDISITGICFGGSCNTGRMGVNEAMRYYMGQAISQTGYPVGIQIGINVFRAFLVEGNFSITNPETNLGQMTLNFKGIPE